MKNKISVFATSAVLFVMPMMVHAQSDGIGSFIGKVQSWVNALLPIMITIGVLAFFFGLAKFLFGGAEDLKAGRSIMIMGILAVFIMASIGGIVSMLQRTTDTDGGGALKPPCIGRDCQSGGVINGAGTNGGATNSGAPGFRNN